MTFTADNRPYQTNTTGEALQKQRLYSIWKTMNRRCYEPNKKEYKNYGGRGITVCDEWSYNNPNGYENFRVWSLQNGYTEDLTIDRIDPNGDYEPLNCRWATQKTQQRNRTNNHPVIVNGIEYKALSEAIEALGRTEDDKAIRQRIFLYGWTAQQAFTEPIKHCKPVTVCIDGITYNTVKEACEALKLNYGTIATYKCNYHTTYEEAIKHYLSH